MEAPPWIIKCDRRRSAAEEDKWSHWNEGKRRAGRKEDGRTRYGGCMRNIRVVGGMNWVTLGQYNCAVEREIESGEIQKGDANSE